MDEINSCDTIVTYKEDKPVVVAAIKRMKAEGLYPEYLWEK